MDDNISQETALWGYEEPTWFKIYVRMMSGPLTVVDVSSEDTFDQVKFWIWVKEGIMPYQQRLFVSLVGVDDDGIEQSVEQFFSNLVEVDADGIDESCDVFLVVETRVSAMYRALLGSPIVREEFIGPTARNRGGKGIQRVQGMISIISRYWVQQDVPMFTCDELEELRVMLATDRGWNCGIEAA
jgi:hypothetical protein